MRIFWALLLPCFCLGQTLAPITPTTRVVASDKSKLGWTPKVRVEGNLSFTSNQDVIGQTDGSSETYGVNFKGELNHVSESWEWRNTLNIKEATTKTASLPNFVKTGDNVNYDTLVLYSLPPVPQIGPYVRGSLETSFFRGDDIRENETNYVVNYRDGTNQRITATQIQLTDPFRPLTTKESTGFFWKAVEEQKTNLEFRLGVGALQISAKNQFAVTESSASQITLSELKSFEQFGGEAGVAFKGQIDERTHYEAATEILTPIFWTHEPGETRNGIRLTNIDMSLKLSTKINDWASFGYDYRLKLQPQLVDQTQQTHLLVIGINYDLL